MAGFRASAFFILCIVACAPARGGGDDGPSGENSDLSGLTLALRELMSQSEESPSIDTEPNSPEPDTRPGSNMAEESRTVQVRARAEVVAVSAVDSETTESPYSDVPPGFEALLEPQATLVDVYAGGRFLDTLAARFTPNEIEFDDPGRIVNLLPDLLDPLAVRDALSGSLESNAMLVCRRGQTDGCGQLFPDIAAVIFDENRFRADIYVNPALLALREVPVQKYLPASSAGLSLLQSLSGAFAGDEDDTLRQRSLYGVSTLAYRENRLRAQTYYDNQLGHAEMDELSVIRDWQGVNYQAGLFRSGSQGLQFLEETGIWGVRLASTLDTRADQRQSFGREIEVYLPLRSNVAIFKDGRLVSSRTYEAGNQALDTRDLPGGAYDIELRINDARGERVETRFYTKSLRLPPADQALYVVEAGQVAEREDDELLARSSSRDYMHGSVSRRFNDSLAWTAGATLADGDQLMEAGIFNIGSGYEFGLSLAVDSDSARGLSGNAQIRWNTVGISANYRQIWSDVVTDPLAANTFASLLGEEQTQGSLSVNFPLFDGAMRLDSRYNSRAGQESFTAHVVHYSFPYYNVHGVGLRVALEYGREDSLDIGRVTFELQRDTRHFTHRLGLENQYRDQPSGNIENREVFQSTWYDGDVLASDLQVGAQAIRDDDVKILGADMEWRLRQGRMRLGADHSEFSGETVDNYNGNFSTSLVVTPDSVSAGGSDLSQSTVLVTVDGEAQDAWFDIYVDGVKRGYAAVGANTVLNLRPFETYRVSIKPRGASFLDFDQRDREVTLYPGNIVPLVWRVREVYAAFGRVVDDAGIPVTNALLHGVAGLATTDDAGFFQAELPADAKSLEVETRSGHCVVQVPPYQVRRGIANLRSLRCDLLEK